MSNKMQIGYTKEAKGMVSEKREMIALRKIRVPEFIERNNIEKIALEALAENIKQVGLINPLTVKRVGDNFEIVAGHRRYLALKMLGTSKVSCMIITENKLIEEMIKLSENLLREDLNDIEEANFLFRLKKLGKLTEKGLAFKIGHSESYVRQKLAILKYPDELREALETGKIKFSVARELVRIKSSALLHEYLKHTIRGGATPALVKEWVDEIITQEKLKRGEKKEDEGVKPGLQMQQPLFKCFACENITDLSASKLYRICEKCISEIFEGGQG